MKFSSDQPTTHARKASWCSVINTHPTAGWFDVFSKAMTDPCATCPYGPAHGIDCDDCLGDYDSASHTTPSNARFLFSRVAGHSFFAALAEAARMVLACFAVAAILVALQCLGGMP